MFWSTNYLTFYCILLFVQLFIVAANELEVPTQSQKIAYFHFATQGEYILVLVLKCLPQWTLFTFLGLSEADVIIVG